ncbi:MAG: hypothetical protein E7483_01820 [Ruminococcaceae bacterium]|nr:hypothetical protein [Oscillospiraceae bacterium]
MNKKLDKMLNAVIGGFTGSFLGVAAYRYYHFRTNPQIYAAMSAPWHAYLIVPGIACGLVVLAAIIIKIIVSRKN